MTPEELDAIQAAEFDDANEDEKFDDSKTDDDQPDGEASGQPESQDESGPSQLPDELGLDYEQVRMLLAMKHETTMSKDDPVMMLVTILNAFLAELQKLHGNHNQAVTKIMSSQTSSYIAGVKATTDALSETLADKSVEAIRNIFANHGKALYSSTINCRWCTAIIAVSALANVVVMALK